MNRFIVGVDIGVTGAICLFDVNTGRIIALDDMPFFLSDSKHKKIDTTEICNLLTKYIRMGATLMIIEDVHAMPAVGSVASFSMGYGKGVFEGMAKALKLPHQRVSPRKWKAHYGLLKAAKVESITVAKQLYPDSKKWLTLMKHHNRAEAILLASLPARIYLA